MLVSFGFRLGRDKQRRSTPAENSTTSRSAAEDTDNMSGLFAIRTSTANATKTEVISFMNVARILFDDAKAMRAEINSIMVGGSRPEVNAWTASTLSITKPSCNP
jgi:hypothetical protein